MHCVGLLPNGAKEGWQRYCSYVHNAVHQLVLHQIGHPYHDPSPHRKLNMLNYMLYPNLIQHIICWILYVLYCMINCMLSDTYVVISYII